METYRRREARAPFRIDGRFFEAHGARRKSARSACRSRGRFKASKPHAAPRCGKRAGSEKTTPDTFLSVPESEIAFDALDVFETITWDYDAASHSTHGHPLAPLREALKAQKIPDARTVAQMKNGRRVRYAGLVICRQRPGTAAGVTFMTLEDESGFVNLVLWPKKFEEYAVLAKTTPFLGVTGKVQSEQSVVHLIVDKLWTPKLTLEPKPMRSHDFH